MDNNILNHYSEELRYLSQLFEEFATAHPGIARDLHIGTQHSEDPHVSRMVQSFALISGQIKQLLNDNFSELPSALLDLLYPHYLAPIPSCAIAHFQPEKDLTNLKTVSAGRSIEVHFQQNSHVCYFTTVYDTDLLPIELSLAKLSAVSKETEHLFEKSDGRSVLKLTLQTYDKALNFNQLGFKKLRFFIKAPNVSAYQLYDLLFCHALELFGYADADNKQLFQVPSANCLKPVGFEKSETMLNYTARSSLGYSLLTEFFAFPEKFLFFDICFTESMAQSLSSNKINLYIMFNKREERLEPYVNKNYLSLHCSPMINLFKKNAEPILLDYAHSEYPIIPDLDSTKKIEVNQVLKASVVDNENNHYDCRPFFSTNHYDSQSDLQYFWQLHRRASVLDGEQNKAYISLLDLALKKTSSVDSVLALQLLCTNGNLPKQNALNGSEVHLQFQEGAAPIEKISVTTNFTAKRQWPLKEESYWRLVSHLNLNQLSLYDNHAECEVLREVLHLYDFLDEDNSRQLINSIKNILTEKILLRDPSGILNTFVQGLKIKLIIALPAISGHSLFLFGSILDHLFALNCALNSFTQLEICDEQHKVLHTWPARSGSKLIL